jgi:predicted nucleic acid-binding protein
MLATTSCPSAPASTRRSGKLSDAALPAGHQYRQPIGVRDLHIAGHARSEGLVLVTNDLSEFVCVPALEVENWVHPGQQATETWWFSVIDKV